MTKYNYTTLCLHSRRDPGERSAPGIFKSAGKQLFSNNFKCYFSQKVHPDLSVVFTNNFATSTSGSTDLPERGTQNGTASLSVQTAGTQLSTRQISWMLTLQKVRNTRNNGCHGTWLMNPGFWNTVSRISG